MVKRSPQTPKYKQVYAALWREIQSGRLHDGDRLPSEAELERRFAASRITVGRAMRDLQSAGLVERRAGSGTYVRTPRVEGALSFGLLIPDLGETEIFEPICQGMMASPLAREHALVWGSLNRADGSKEERAWQLSRQYIERRVAGVFFAPLELTSTKDDVNRRIADALDEAGIPIVLLDRTVAAYPRRGHHDLVGIDNRRAGYVITEHLLRLGARRIAFVTQPHAAATVDAREAATARRSTPATCRSTGAWCTAWTPRIRIRSKLSWLVPNPTPSSAQTIEQPRGSCAPSCARTTGYHTMCDWSASTMWSMRACCRFR